MFEVLICAYRWMFLQMSDVFGLGWSIVLLSGICSALMIPLMRLVGGIVQMESEYQAVLAPQLQSIKARFSTDVERHLQTQSLYKRYGYSPIFAIKKVLPLFVQIPFLLLTYFMLNGMPQLDGVSFLFLSDLGSPDRLAPMEINLLPIAMTVINLFTVVATADFTSRDRLQAVCIALLFLGLLYSAPSALLLYWTLNNLITLIRTLAIKRGEGAKLLFERVLILRSIPSQLKAFLTPPNVAYISLVCLILALYMRLMVYMQVYFFNYMASYWGMLSVISMVIILEIFLFKEDKKKICRLVSYCAAGCAVVIIVANVAIVASILVSFDLLMLITRTFNFAVVFDALFLLWVGIVILRIRTKILSGLKDTLKTIGAQWVWLLIPITFAIHYAFASADFKLPVYALLLFALYMVLPCLATFGLLSTAYGSYFSVINILRLTVGIFTGIYLIPMVSLESGKLLGYGSNIVLRVFLMAAFALVFYKWGNKKVFKLFIPLLLIMALLNVGVSQYTRLRETEIKVDTATLSEAQKAFSALSPKKTNSVYFLVYDGYVHDTILRGMKFEHSDIATQLMEKGFTRYDAYSVGSDTVASMGATFAIGNVFQGSNRSILAGNNPFCDFLRRANYRTSYILCGYEMPYHGERMPGDFYFPSPQEITRPEMVLYPCIFKGILSQTANTFNVYTTEEWIAEKQKAIRAMRATCDFMYSHTPYPGHIPPHPAYWKSPEEERARFERGLELADKEILNDVNMILEKQDDSIIIIASDHGSFFPQPDEIGDYDAFTLLDRCGVQMLVRWPKDYKPCMEINCLQNIFLEVLIYLSNDFSLARFKSEGESLRVQYPLRAPAGTIKNGIIQSGKDAGKNIFEAAAEAADKMQ